MEKPLNVQSRSELKNSIAVQTQFFGLMVIPMTWLCLGSWKRIPILTYGIEVVHVSNQDERRQLRVAYNSVFRNIFRYRWSESVSALQSFLYRPTWEELLEERHSCFIQRLLAGHTVTLAQYLL